MRITASHSGPSSLLLQLERILIEPNPHYLCLDKRDGNQFSTSVVQEISEREREREREREKERERERERGRGLLAHVIA